MQNWLIFDDHLTLCSFDRLDWGIFVYDAMSFDRLKNRDKKKSEFDFLFECVCLLRCTIFAIPFFSFFTFYNFFMLFEDKIIDWEKKEKKKIQF